MTTKDSEPAYLALASSYEEVFTEWADTEQAIWEVTIADGLVGTPTASSPTR